MECGHLAESFFRGLHAQGGLGGIKARMVDFR